MGIVCYEGPSPITGQPIVAILTGANGDRRTANPKTGDMAQLWILYRDEEPHLARRSGNNKAVCGNCPAEEICYVLTHQAPLQIWRKYREGAYPKATTLDLKRALTGRKLRFGAYGDPAALPLKLIKTLARLSAGHVGYTHQWREARVQPYHRYLMASVESPEGLVDARLLGWRTFRVRKQSDVKLDGEIVCPASAEGGKRRQCASCMACDGATRPGQASVVIIEH